MKKSSAILVYFLLFSLLSGCLYPQEKRQQIDQLPQHMMRVQSAVEAYEKEHQVLPYLYTEEEYKLTTKYKVNFKELQAYGDIPPTAFERGGNFLYVIIGVDTKPTVRVFDLRVNEEISKVQPYVTQYVKKYGEVPGKEPVGAGYYTIDFDKLKMDAAEIPSPYSTGTHLPLLVDQKGVVYVDYRSEVMKKMQATAAKPDAEQDLREWLAQDSFFVPAFSPVMKVENGDPVFVSKP